MTQTSTRAKIIAGNWKMNKTIADAVQFVHDLAPVVSSTKARVFLAVPFTAIASAAEKAKQSSLWIGAQNMYDAKEGAFTGEISSQMLIDAGAKFVILGHSERRQIFQETSTFINRKVKRAIEDNIQPILCVGENLEEREQGIAQEVIEKQIKESLAGIDESQIKKLILAYEPVWAIGTGKTATPELAQEMHHFCRALIEKLWGKAAADSVSILYGGSATPANASSLMNQKDIDGVLVGGASLSVDSFSQIVNY